MKIPSCWALWSSLPGDVTYHVNPASLVEFARPPPLPAQEPPGGPGPRDPRCRPARAEPVWASAPWWSCLFPWSALKPPGSYTLLSKIYPLFFLEKVKIPTRTAHSRPPNSETETYRVTSKSLCRWPWWCRNAQHSILGLASQMGARR